MIYEQLQKIYELLRKREELIIPKIVKSNEKKKRTFSIYTEILEKLDVVSDATGIHKSRIVEEALIEFLRKYEEADEMYQDK